MSELPKQAHLHQNRPREKKEVQRRSMTMGRLTGAVRRAVHSRARHQHPRLQKKPKPSRKELVSSVSKILGKRHCSVRQASSEVAVKLNMSPEKIRSAYRKASLHLDREHGSRLFTDEEECALAAAADARSLCAIPFKKQEFIALAKHLRPDLESHSLRSWFLDFMTRWKSRLGVNASKGLEGERLDPATLVNCERWVQEYPEYLRRYKLSEKNTINADETRIRTNFGSKGEITINTVRREKHSRKEDKGTKYGTYLPFVFASGDLAMDVFIIPTALHPNSKPGLHRAAQEAPGGPPTFWATTDSGYLEGSLWCDCLKELKGVVAISHPGIEICVLTGNLSAHHMESTLEWGIKNHVHVFFLPPDVTHFLNPPGRPVLHDVQG